MVKLKGFTYNAHRSTQAQSLRRIVNILEKMWWAKRHPETEAHSLLRIANALEGLLDYQDQAMKFLRGKKPAAKDERRGGLLAIKYKTNNPLTKDQ